MQLILEKRINIKSDLFGKGFSQVELIFTSVVHIPTSHFPEKKTISLIGILSSSVPQKIIDT